jgi:hypothetical protein
VVQKFFFWLAFKLLWSWMKSNNTGETMKFFVATGIVLFISSISQALYIPGNNERTIYRCLNEVVLAQVSLNNEGEFKLRMAPVDAGIINLYLDEKANDAETSRGRIFTSKRAILKIDHNDMGIEKSSLMISMGQDQVTRMELDCHLIFSIMDQTAAAE